MSRLSLITTTITVTMTIKITILQLKLQLQYHRVGEQKEVGRRPPRSVSESSESVQNSRKNNKKKKKRTSSETVPKETVSKERADSVTETTGLFLGDQDFVPLQQWYVGFRCWVPRGVKSPCLYLQSGWEIDDLTGTNVNVLS